MARKSWIQLTRATRDRPHNGSPMKVGSPFWGSTTIPHPAHWKMSLTYCTRPRTNSSPRLQMIIASIPAPAMVSRSTR